MIDKKTTKVIKEVFKMLAELKEIQKLKLETEIEKNKNIIAYDLQKLCNKSDWEKIKKDVCNLSEPDYNIVRDLIVCGLNPEKSIKLIPEINHIAIVSSLEKSEVVKIIVSVINKYYE